MPTISTSTGGFVGNMRTNFGFFNTVEKPEVLINSKDSEEQEQDQINYRPPSYIQIRHDRQRTRYTSNRLDRIRSNFRKNILYVNFVITRFILNLFISIKNHQQRKHRRHIRAQPHRQLQVVSTRDEWYKNDMKKTKFLHMLRNN